MLLLCVSQMALMQISSVKTFQNRSLAASGVSSVRLVIFW